MANIIEKAKARLKEARGSDYTLYHKSYTDAINHALSHHQKSGLHVSDDDRFQHVGVGSKKPSEGNTTSVSMPATHTSGKKHMVHVQVFNKGGTHPYELNTYSSGMGRSVKEDAEHVNCGTPECCGECAAPIEEVNNHYPREGFPKEGDYGYHSNVGLKPQESDSDEDMDKAYKVANGDEAKKPLNAQTTEVSNKVEEAYGMWKVDFPKQHAGKAVAAGSVHVKAQNTAHAHKVAAKRVGVDHTVFKSKVTKSSILPEERGEDSKGHYRATEDGAGLTRKGAKAMGIKTAVTTPPSKLDPKGEAAGRRKSFCARMGGMKGPMKDEKGRPTRKAMSLRRWNCNEELGKENEWGSPELRKKFAAMTPGQEGLAADNIPAMNPFSGDAIQEQQLDEISALGAKKRSEFAAKLRKTLADPKKIAKAKKDIAKKKAVQRAEEPKHLVMQLRKATSIGSKVKFYDGAEHHVAPNHVEKFNDRYHSLKSSIEKESLVKRAHKSHADFMRAISEETMGQTMGPCTDNISPANYPSPYHLSPLPGLENMNADDSTNQWTEGDLAAIEADVTNEIESSSWQDLSKYYDAEEDDEDEDEGEDGLDEAEVKQYIEITHQSGNKKRVPVHPVNAKKALARYRDDPTTKSAQFVNEDLNEAITPQGRLKKKFAAMRNKTRRNLAKNMAMKRIATPDVIKGRSIRAARRMVYKRILRNRDPSSVSASEKARIEAQVKRMAPMVSRLSIRLQQSERKRDQARVTNARTKKK
jgi:hypothetical protein